MAHSTWAVLIATVLTVLGGAALAQPRPGDPAPDLALPDLEGAIHRLSDHRGGTVAIEWTSHVRPVVRRAEDLGALEHTWVLTRAEP